MHESKQRSKLLNMWLLAITGLKKSTSKRTKT